MRRGQIATAHRIAMISSIMIMVWTIPKLRLSRATNRAAIGAARNINSRKIRDIANLALIRPAGRAPSSLASAGMQYRGKADGNYVAGRQGAVGIMVPMSAGPCLPPAIWIRRKCLGLAVRLTRAAEMKAFELVFQSLVFFRSLSSFAGLAGSTAPYRDGGAAMLAGCHAGPETR